METYISSLLFAVRITLRLVKRIAPEKWTELSGVWCSCWQHGDDQNSYETGSIEIYQLGKIVVGAFYHKDTKWPMKGTWDGQLLNGIYLDDRVGQFHMTRAHGGTHMDLFEGAFTGRIDKKERYAPVICSNLKVTMARGENTVCDSCGHLDITTEKTCNP